MGLKIIFFGKFWTNCLESPEGLQPIDLAEPEAQEDVLLSKLTE